MTPPSAPGSSSTEGGFSILEVVIAIAILMTVLVSVSSLLQTDFKVGANSRYEQEATEIASATLDSQLATGATTLLGKSGYTSLTSVTSGGQVYLLEMEVSPYDPSNSQCVSPFSDSGAMLQVDIWATWTNQASGATWWVSGSSASTGLRVEETSLLAVPAADVNPLMGSILVTVEGAAGQAISDLSVTATPSSGSAETVTTTGGGCALFANVAASPTTWTISFGSLSGYITEQELSTIPTQSALSVTADTTTSVSFEPIATVTPPYSAYDKEATVTPTYAVPMADGVHPILPSNISSLPLSFYSSNLTTSPYVSGSPAEVFPMDNVPSYYVVAGTCGAESAPDGDTVDGQPVTLTAGGTAAPAFNLVPVQIFVNQGGNLVSGATVTASVSNATGGTDTNCPTSGAGVMPTLQLGSTTATWSSFVRGHKRHPHAIFVTGCGSNCATTTLLSSSSNPSISGTSVTFTATVSCTSACNSTTPGTTPTGTVTFLDGTNTLGTGTLSGGVATYTTSTLSAATHSITAAYGVVAGKWQASTSSVLSQVVAASTATVLTSSANPSTFNGSVTLTATVTPAAAVGTVAFKDGTTTLGSGTVNNVTGVATYATTALALGSHSLSAVFTPTNSNNYATSTGTLTQVVNAGSGTGYTLAGLPYGVWLLSATYVNGGTTYKSSNETTQVVLTVSSSGISINGGTTWLTPGSAVTVYVK